MSLSEIYNLVCVFAAITVLCPIIVAFLRIKAFNKSLKALFLFLILCLISDITSFIIVNTDNSNQIDIIYNTYTVLECICVLTIYFQEYKTRKSRSIILGCFILFIIFAAHQFFWMKKYILDDNSVNSMEAVLIIVLGGIYFIKIILDENLSKLTDQYFYWINLAFIIYFSASLLIFLNSSFLTHCSPAVACVLYSIHLIVNAFCNVLFSIGIWRVNRAQLY